MFHSNGCLEWKKIGTQCLFKDNVTSYFKMIVIIIIITRSMKNLLAMYINHSLILNKNTNCSGTRR